MAVRADQAARLARRLRELREKHWADVELTQAQLAAAFSTENRVAPATISSWESTTNPKTPTTVRLGAYARFFATRRSLDGHHHLIPEVEFTPEEEEQRRDLEKELLGLLEIRGRERHGTFSFDEGPVTIICPDAPQESRGALAQETDPNFTKLQQFGDLDALIDIYGHLRESNPGIAVNYRLASEVRAEDMSSHVILLGGLGWNHITKRFQEAIEQVPVIQVDVKGYPGDIFEVDGDEKRPKWETGDGGQRELLEDVAFVARLDNPFNIRRTLTICNGVHSRGVLGAVRCFTDPQVREANEQYLDGRFPDGGYALLLRVPVVGNETLTPDLQNPWARLYEWPS
jgi:hypothetical protein